MKNFLGIKYGRGCTANIITGGPALAPDVVRNLFPDAEWTMVAPDDMPPEEIMSDRFGENCLIQQKIYNATPNVPHIMIGGDHSVNFGHFVRIADDLNTDDLCLVYVDAHLDIHTPESSRAQASGAPHGTNVRALLGDGDARWFAIGKHTPALKPENVFYIGTRSYEPAEIDFIHKNNIFMRPANQLTTMDAVNATIDEIRAKIGNRPYVVSFDFDAIDPKYFGDVLVPESGGLTGGAAARIVAAFAPHAHSVEFVEYSPTGDASSREIVYSLVSIACGE